MGSADPLEKMDEKFKKRKHAKRAVFYVYAIFFESNQGRQM